MNTKSEKLKRTILYYPSIALPNNTWLRQALLYWDQISSVVPKDIHSREWMIDSNSEIDFLIDEDEYRAIGPMALYENGREELAI